MIKFLFSAAQQPFIDVSKAAILEFATLKPAILSKPTRWLV